nr:RAMP superfamily CRISPR-associated protein [uncultured Rhodopila sp.]
MSTGAEVPRDRLHLLRITIEALSPLSFGSGDVLTVERRHRTGDAMESRRADVTALVRDCNGLPVIPGATLQGRLRHLYDAEYGDAETRILFGYAEGTKGDAGRLFAGFAAVHDQDDHALTGLVTDATRIKKDPILRALRQDEPLRRDHVALNARHVADGRKKFDRRAVPIGTRFSTEFALWGTEAEASEDKAALARIVRLFGHPAFRIGGGGHHGYGRVVVRRCSYACLGLDNTAALRRLRTQEPSVSLAENIVPEIDAFGRAVTMKLRLTPINPWRIGGHGHYLTENTHGTRLADGGTVSKTGAGLREEREAADVATILREPVIAWANGKAELRETTQTSAFEPRLPNGVAFSVPGSAIKGPLVHRALFHWNRLRSDIDGMIDVETWLKLDVAEQAEAMKKLADRPLELGYLFGTAKERAGDAGRAGCAFFNDGAVADVQAVQAMDHIVIDRFSGGVFPGLLYVEEVLAGGSVETTITMLPPPREAGGTDWPANIRDAFLLALRDLCSGQLAIGAKSLGFCTGDIVAWTGADDLKSPWETAWLALAGATPGKAGA